MVRFRNHPYLSELIGLSVEAAKNRTERMSQATTKFPARLEELTPELMTTVLAENSPGVRVEKINALAWAHCGDGIASTADRVSLELLYEKGADAGLPNRVILKTILLHRLLRFGFPVIMMLSRMLKALDVVPLINHITRPAIFTLVNIYQRFFPHAPESMYSNEVRFYHDIRPEIAIETPASYGTVFDQETGQFGIIMEDLSRKSARFPNATQEVTLDEVRDLTWILAQLHAQYWKSPRFQGDLAWVPTRTEGGMFPVFDTIGLDLIRDQVNKNRFKQDLLAPLGRSVKQLWDDLWKAQAILDQGPQTLLHGDAHIGNCYLLPGEKGGLLDWQLMVRGCWAQDLTYMMITGVSADTRRKHERGIIEFYLDELGRHGVEDVPTNEQAWRNYRLSVIWGLVIGWLITPPQNYGRAITEANISRLVTAARDLDSFAALDEARGS
jgi:hypothetical protein